MNPRLRRVLRIGLQLLLFGGLAYLYDLATLVALGWFNSLELPWMPYWGKPPLTVALLIHTGSALAVLAAALPAGLAAACAAGARPFLYGLGLAAPTFVDQARSTPPLVGHSFFANLFSFMYCLEVLLPMLLLPALAAWGVRLLLAHWRKRGAAA